MQVLNSVTSRVRRLDAALASHGRFVGPYGKLTDILRRTVYWPLAGVLISIVLWATALPTIDPRQMTDLGLISVLPLSVYLAFAVLLISFCQAVWNRRTPVWLLLLHVATLVVIIHGTPYIVYGTLRYSWAWKHVGIVDYIQRHGSVNPNISNLDVYHNWPGFFALNAFITQITGADSALAYAGWAQVFFELLNLGALVLIFKTFTRDQRLIWFGVWLFFLTNWVGQDYFSPQALGYFLHLTILGVCLRWFKGSGPQVLMTMLHWPWVQRIVTKLQTMAGRPAQHYAPDDSLTSPIRRAGLMAIVILLFIDIASTHQLTPLMTIVGLTVLAIFGVSNARSLPALLAVLAIVWVLYGAGGYLDRQLASTVESVGQVTNNIGGNFIDVYTVSPNTQLISYMARGLTGLIGALALLGGVRRLRHGYMDLSAILLAGTSVAMVGSNDYGGEILFRVYLFALPFLAFFAAALIFATPMLGTSWRTALIATGLCGIVLTAFLFAYYGKDREYYFTQDEVNAAAYLDSVAPAGSLLIEGNRNYPVQFRNYENFTYVTIDEEGTDTENRIIANPDGVLTDWMSNSDYSATYLFITRSQKIEVDTLGAMPRGSLAAIEQQLLNSPNFRVLYWNKDAVILTLANTAGGIQ